jgi:hypothetical protein
MKNLNHRNHRNIQLVYESLKIYNTTISCELPLPKFLLDDQGKLFQKQKTIFEGDQSRVLYTEVSITSLSSVEVATIPAVDANYSVVK